MPSSRVSTQGTAGLYAKMFNEEISFTLVVCRHLFHSADELWQVAQSGRQKEVGRKHRIWGKYLQFPALSWVAFTSLWCGRSEKRLWQVSLLVQVVKVILTPRFTASTQKQLRSVQAWLIPTTDPSSNGWSPFLCDICELTTHEPETVSPWSTDPAGPGLVSHHVLPLST